MAFNILNIGFDGTVSSSFADRSTYINENDNGDIFYYIGTNFGTSAWVNPLNTSFVTATSGASPSVVNRENATDLDNTSATRYSVADDSPVTLAIDYQLNNLIIQPTTVQVAIASTGLSQIFSNIKFQASNTGSNWQDLITFPDTATGDSTFTFLNPVNLPNADYWSYFRLVWTASNQFSNTGISNLLIYGNLKRLDGGRASKISLPRTINQLDDVIIESPNDGDYLYWDQAIAKHQREKLYETLRTTDNVVLEDDQYLPNFYIITPSITRTVDLPPNPVAGQFFRIKNLNNLNQIDIREPGPTVVVSIGGTGGPGLTQADCYYDGVEWQIISG